MEAIFMATTQYRAASHDGEPNRQPSGAKQFDPDHLSIHHPPWFSYWLANIGVVSGILANLWQVFTSVVAFFTLFSEGAIYKSLDNHGQVGATFAALAIALLMAVSFQLGVMFFVFKVAAAFKEQKIKVGVDGNAAIKSTAVQMIHHHRLLSAWMLVSFFADTVGDFTFINSISNDVFMLLGYTLSLYAVSTVLLSASLERHWAAKVGLENWRAFKAYTKLMSLKIQQAQHKAEDK
jgi:hypothetical protein